MRKALTMMLESDPGIKVIGSARNGEEGVAKVKQLKPDLVTMDVEMPQMDGLAALRQIMKTNPVPVMMVSSITTDGAKATLEALELGAVDFIPKQMSYVSLDIVKIKDDLLAKIKDIVRRKHVLMARYKTRSSFTQAAAPAGAKVIPPAQKQGYVLPGKRRHKIDIIAIGSSTGGPPALQTVIPQLPRNLPVGVIVSQHMPPMFTKSLAERLDTISKVSVHEAEDGEPIEPGTVLVAPGGKHLTVKRYGGKARAVVSEEPSTTLYKPCVDVMFTSVAAAYARTCMGVVLTGMGNNGLVGARKIKQTGGIMIAQNEETCVVYGMPRAVAEAELTDHVAPIEYVAGEITSYF
ncbi:chemotaxis-specific protein-glutamate methyltransferase CheB [candidate division GN15 bacterium]|nr:chemotaxis-specific protein-glutamate methyltransferase CheB [candidate division GN15 bacterium]